MAIRITDPETEQIIREMAELHQISPSDAVHKAVDQWLSALNLTSRESKVVEELVNRRVLIAFLDGQDTEARSSLDEVRTILAILVFGLAGAILVGAFTRSRSFLDFAVGMILPALWAYSQRRTLTRETAERSKGARGN